MKKYKKEQINPVNNQWFENGVAVLTDETAELLNSHSGSTRIRYVEVKTRAKKQEVKKEN